MAGLEGIRACVFDAYGTLFDVGSPVQKLATEIGDKAANLAVLWRQKQLEYTWLRSLMGVHADFWHVTGDALDFSLEALKIEDPGLRDELMTLYLKLDAYPDVAEALTGGAGQEQAHGHPLQWQPLHAGQRGARRRPGKILRHGSVGGGCGNLQAEPAGLPPRHAETANPGRAVDLLCLRQQLGRAGGGAVRLSGRQAGAQRRAG